MAIKAEHLGGFVVGLGAAAVGFYAYRKNHAQINDWLRRQGINVPSPAEKSYDSLSMKDLVTEKERLEDLIAEREMSSKSEEKTPSDK